MQNFTSPIDKNIANTSKQSCRGVSPSKLNQEKSSSIKTSESQASSSKQNQSSKKTKGKSNEGEGSSSIQENEGQPSSASKKKKDKQTINNSTDASIINSGEEMLNSSTNRQFTYHDLMSSRYNPYSSLATGSYRQNLAAQNSIFSQMSNAGSPSVDPHHSSSNTALPYQQQSQSHQQQQQQAGATSTSTRQRGHGKQGKKQQSIDIINPTTLSQKEFRVFYGLITVHDDFASPIHSKKAKSGSKSSCKQYDSESKQKEIKEDSKQFTAENNPIESDMKLNQLQGKQNEGICEADGSKVAKTNSVDENSNDSQPVDQQEQIEVINLGGGIQEQSEKTGHLKNIKEWFQNLSSDERVNALTTTSPYLSEILINMKRQIIDMRKGPTLFAQQPQTNSKNSSHYLQNSFDQQYMQYKTPKTQAQLNQHYSQGYGPQYFMAANSKYQGFTQYQGDVFGNQYDYEHDLGCIQANNTYFIESIYKRFEDHFYCRQQQKNEIEQFKSSEPLIHQAQNFLFNNVRFSDFLVYADTITISHEAVKDHETFFEALDKVSNGQAFSSPCQMLYDSKLGMHQIDHPNWFKPERFQSYASWIAAIYEENLWANFLNHINKNSSQAVKGYQQVSGINYMFDINEIQQSIGESFPIYKLHSLTNSWLTSTQIQKQKIIDNLQSIITGSNSDQQKPPSKGKKQKDDTFNRENFLMPSQEIRSSFIRQNSFFYIDKGQAQLRLIVHDGQLNELVQQSFQNNKVNQTQDATNKKQKQKKKQKSQSFVDGASACQFDANYEENQSLYNQTFDFIVNLIQSDVQNVEQGIDIAKRTLFKLIQQMHQDQVLQDLLWNEAGGEVVDDTGGNGVAALGIQKNKPSANKNKKKKKKVNQKAGNSDAVNPEITQVKEDFEPIINETLPNEKLDKLSIQEEGVSQKQQNSSAIIDEPPLAALAGDGTPADPLKSKQAIINNKPLDQQKHELLNQNNESIISEQNVIGNQKPKSYGCQANQKQQKQIDNQQKMNQLNLQNSSLRVQQINIQSNNDKRKLKNPFQEDEADSSQSNQDILDTENQQDYEVVSSDDGLEDDSDEYNNADDENGQVNDLNVSIKNLEKSNPTTIVIESGSLNEDLNDYERVTNKRDKTKSKANKQQLEEQKKSKTNAQKPKQKDTDIQSKLKNKRITQQIDQNTSNENIIQQEGDEAEDCLMTPSKVQEQLIQKKNSSSVNSASSHKTKKKKHFNKKISNEYVSDILVKLDSSKIEPQVNNSQVSMDGTQVSKFVDIENENEEVIQDFPCTNEGDDQEVVVTSDNKDAVLKAASKSKYQKRKKKNANTGQDSLDTVLKVPTQAEKIDIIDVIQHEEGDKQAEEEGSQLQQPVEKKKKSSKKGTKQKVEACESPLQIIEQLAIQKNQTAIHSSNLHLDYQKESEIKTMTMSRNVSLSEKSNMSKTQGDGQNATTGRKRNRKKGKGNVDHQEAMNNFVKNLHAKPEGGNFDKHKPANFNKPQNSGNGQGLGSNRHVRKASDITYSNKNTSYVSGFDQQSNQQQPAANHQRRNQQSQQIYQNYGNDSEYYGAGSSQQNQQFNKQESQDQSNGNKNKKKKDDNQSLNQNKKEFKKNMYQEKTPFGEINQQDELVMINDPLSNQSQAHQFETSSNQGQSSTLLIKPKKKGHFKNMSMAIPSTTVIQNQFQNLNGQEGSTDSKPDKQISVLKSRQEIIDAFNVVNQFGAGRKEGGVKNQKDDSQKQSEGQKKKNQKQISVRDAESEQNSEVDNIDESPKQMLDDFSSVNDIIYNTNNNLHEFPQSPQLIEFKGNLNQQQIGNLKSKSQQYGGFDQTTSKINANSPSFKPSQSLIPQNQLFSPPFYQDNDHMQNNFEGQNFDKKLGKYGNQMMGQGNNLAYGSDYQHPQIMMGSQFYEPQFTNNYGTSSEHLHNSMSQEDIIENGSVDKQVSFQSRNYGRDSTLAPQQQDNLSSQQPFLSTNALPHHQKSHPFIAPSLVGGQQRKFKNKRGYGQEGTQQFTGTHQLHETEDGNQINWTQQANNGVTRSVNISRKTSKDLKELNEPQQIKLADQIGKSGYMPSQSMKIKNPKNNMDEAELQQYKYIDDKISDIIMGQSPMRQDTKISFKNQQNSHGSGVFMNNQYQMQQPHNQVNHGDFQYRQPDQSKLNNNQMSFTSGNSDIQKVRNVNYNMNQQQQISMLEQANKFQNQIQNIIDNASQGAGNTANEEIMDSTQYTSDQVSNKEEQVSRKNSQVEKDVPQQPHEYSFKGVNQNTFNDIFSKKESQSREDQTASQGNGTPNTSRSQTNDQFAMGNNQFGQMNGQINHINQMNSYNINQFGGMNMPNQQIMPQFQNMQVPSMMTLTNQQRPAAQQPSQQQQPGFSGAGGFNNNGPLAVPNQQQQPFMNMMPQQNYNHHGHGHPAYFDYNLLQNIEYKFYEKFDNDVYDEVNKIQMQLDLTKKERDYVLAKLQTMCEQVFCSQNGGKDKGKGSPAKNQCVKLVPKIKKFGSLVTGLALESSDMDMAVTNLILPDREMMIENLENFADCLKSWEMIENLKAISTASIPVIKAVVDLNRLRDKEMNGIEADSDQKQRGKKDFGQTQTDVSQEDKLKSQKLSDEKSRIPEHLAKLKIDITFDDNIDQTDEDTDVDIGLPTPITGNMVGSNFNAGYGTGFGMSGGGFGFNATPHQMFNNYQSSIYATSLEHKSHQGLASCKLLKNYVENYKCLKEVAIVLKQFLAKMDLNQPYHGGISSYSTVLLLVAYMNRWDLRMSATLTPARLLMGFLDYYSYYFKVSMFGIDVSNGGSFYEHSSPESLFVILDPLNQQNNTTKNSFLTHEIIKSFRKAFNSLKNLLLKYQQFGNANVTDNLLDVILERNLPDQDQQQNAQQSTDPNNNNAAASTDSPPNQISQKSLSPPLSAGDSKDQKKDNLKQSQQQLKQQQQQQPIQIQIQQIQQIQILQQPIQNN